MVALDEQFHHKVAKARSRRRKDGFGRYRKSLTASASSMNSVACIHPNGRLSGNIPNGTTDSNWQAIETRTNGTANGNLTSQMVWSAAYTNAAGLQDTYSGGVIQPNGRLYFLQDANWDTTAIVGFNSTTGTWAVTQRYVYSPYGNIAVRNADWSTPPPGTQPVVNNLYQGMMLDAVTGLYYERFRNYPPTLGTWISQDPLQYVNGANAYQFVGSAPVGLVDPSGLAAQAPKLHVIVGNDFSQLIDDIEADLQRAGSSFHGWTKKGAGNYVGFVMRRASVVHFAEIGAAKAALKLAIRLATLLNADNPLGWAAGVLGFKGKQAIKIAIKLAELRLAQLRATNGADEVYRGFYQTKLNNGWNTAAILVYYDPFTSTFAGSISGSVGQVTEAGGPNGVGCVRKFFFYFRGSVNAQDRAVNFKY